MQLLCLSASKWYKLSTLTSLLLFNVKSNAATNRWFSGFSSKIFRFQFGKASALMNRVFPSISVQMEQKLKCFWTVLRWREVFRVSAFESMKSKVFRSRVSCTKEFLVMLEIVGKLPKLKFLREQYFLAHEFIIFLQGYQNCILFNCFNQEMLRNLRFQSQAILKNLFSTVDDSNSQEESQLSFKWFSITKFHVTFSKSISENEFK